MHTTLQTAYLRSRDADGSVFGQEEMQRSVAQKFQELKDATWHSVNAARSIEAVESDVRQIADAAVEECQQGKPLQYLWL